MAAAAAAPPRRIGRSSVHMDGGSADRPTPAIDGVGGTSSGRRQGINLFSGPVCAAVFVSCALCIVLFCVYSFLARRRAIASTRHRILRLISESDMDLAFRRLARMPVLPPPPAATTAHPVDVPPPPPVPTTPPPAATRGTSFEWSSQEAAHSKSGPGNCPVCLEPLQGGSNIMAAYACSHVYHVPCIEPWIRQGGPCPVCRCTITSTFTFNSSSNPIPTFNSTSTSTSTPIPTSNSTPNPIPTSTSIPIPASNSNSTSNSRADVPRSPRVSTTHSHTDVPPLPRVATAPSRIDMPSPPLEATSPSQIDMPPPSRAAPARRPQGANSSTATNSGIGNCPVCHEPLHGRTNVMAAHACAHVFHASCIEPWLHNRGSCPVCRCTASPTSDSTSTPSSNPTSTSTPSSNPTSSTSNPSSNSTSSPIGDCPVCLESLLVVGGDVRAAHACGHVFHSRCIEPWLHQQGSCPVCRCTINSTFTSTTTPNPTSTSNSNSTPISTTTSNTIGNCPVCLEPLHADSGDIRAAHMCGHVFHSRCIERWVRQRGSCPVCRCTVIFNSNSNSGGECPMCLEPLRIGGGDVRAAHVCGHIFHSRCIERWLRRRNSCPVCRCIEAME